MKVLVTGHKGYIGPHVVKLFQNAGHQVTGVDLNLFEECAWENLPTADNELSKDFRDLTMDELSGHDCVIHLAAISNDPMGDLVEDLTYANNLRGSIDLAKKSKEAGVPRFLFSGSCSVYGKGESLDLDETANLNPITAYAHSKIETEKEVKKMADDNFAPAYLRNATAYGHSPNLRIDLVVNNLLGCAFVNGNIQIKSDGTPWRPLVHCKDIARAFLAFAEAPREAIFNKAVNIGSNEENYQVKDVADIVQKLLPDAEIVYTNEVGEDPRNYRVNFDLLSEVIPGFKLEYSVESGMVELFDKFKEHNFSKEDFDGDQFVRIRTLKHKLNKLEVAQ
ncbi:MAG: SDR family oxidoreductase [Crocinitomicaceae bacterium]|nr:SDR family oxidoreductase [Crocinitomicaceae bacterium]